jgi:2-keto-4-pentenoate hydratase/2-oxohepta-3-ene-1,7-dioic acid hydratase in catechol pathway
MRYLSFNLDGRASYGIAHGASIHDLGARLGAALPDLRSYLEALAANSAPPRPSRLEADCATSDIVYAPPIPNPHKILCIGLNYEDHRLETGRPQTAFPTIFTRFADTLTGHNTPIHLPSVSTEADFEGELAVVIGRPGYRVPQERAQELIAGYTCFNDVSMRDWQRHTSQFIPGKNFPASGPCGPAIVTPDEVGELAPLKIQTRLNGAVMQSATFSDLIFPVPALIAYISTFTPLRPGDIIITGTPAGVGFKREPQVFLKPGDAFEVEIENVGLLSNPVVAETV